VTQTTPILWDFVMLWLAHVVYSMCTKYEVSIFNRYKNIVEVPNLHIYGQNCHCACMVSRGM